MRQHNHIHHFHPIDDVHYDTVHHDDYARHHHEWSGNQFNTVADNDNQHADDHNLDTPGDDHNHCGFDLHWPPDNHRRTTPTPNNTAAGAAGDRGS